MSTALHSPPPAKHELLDAASAIIKTVDTHARAVNRKWGFGKLPHIVPLEWTEKFRVQKKKYELAAFEACGSLDPAHLEHLRKQADAMLRGFAKLEQLAVENGHLPTPPEHWEFELEDGTPVILVRDRCEMDQVKPDGRAVQIWSLDEVAAVIGKFPELKRAKECFPGAEVIQMRTSKRTHDALNDELSTLPF